MHASDTPQIRLILISMASIALVGPYLVHSRRHQNIRQDDFGFDEYLSRSVMNRSVAAKVAGGYTAEEGEFPSFIGLQIIKVSGRGQALCGGVAISERFILTAAHCSFNNSKFKIFAAPGIWHPNLWRRKGVKTYEVDKICASRDYSTYFDSAPIHDYQILRLKEPIVGIEAAYLPKNDVKIGFSAIAVGNGLIDNSQNPGWKYAESLQALPVKRTDCGRFRHASRICFKSYLPGNIGDTCPGDSGGPIYGESSDGRKVVLGLTSFGPALCKKGINGMSVNTHIHFASKDINNLAKQCN